MARQAARGMVPQPMEELMGEWQTIETAPKGRTVMTKIDNAQGVRNEQPLMLSGMWFVPDGSMYVYYTPTHWRELTASEREAELAKLQRDFRGAGDAFNRARAALSS